MNRTNLKLLADYLFALPTGYEHFEMYSFYSGGFTEVMQPYQAALELPNLTPNCGTAACALGHAPSIPTLEPHPSEDWFDYGERISGLDEDRNTDWVWCFGGFWSDVDNTPKGAAQRIYHLLNEGAAPEDFIEAFELGAHIDVDYSEHYSHLTPTTGAA